MERKSASNSLTRSIIDNRTLAAKKVLTKTQLLQLA